MVSKTRLLDIAIHEEAHSKLQIWEAKRTENEKLLLATITDGVTLEQAAYVLKVNPNTAHRQRAELLKIAKRDLFDIAP